MLIQKILTQSNFSLVTNEGECAGGQDRCPIATVGIESSLGVRPEVWISLTKKRAASRPPVVNAFPSFPEYYLPPSSHPVIIALMCASGVWPAVDRYTCAMKKISTMNAAAVWKNATHVSDRYLSTPQSTHEP